jgi:hypothetical protein
MAELKKARKKTADMTNVKDRGPFNPKHMPEGDYVAKIVAVYDTRNNDDTKDMWVIAFQLQDRRDVVYPYYCTWDESQLWKIRNVFVACGVSIPKKRVALDPARIENKIVGITLEDDEYNGKAKSTIGSVMSVKDMEDGPSTDDDDVDEDDDDDIEEEEVEETPPPKKRRVKKAPEPEPEEEDEDEDEDDEDEEEEEPEPPKRRVKKASPTSRAGGRSAKTSTRASSKPKRRVVDDEDDEDEMDIDEEDL